MYSYNGNNIIQTDLWETFMYSIDTYVYVYINIEFIEI